MMVCWSMAVVMMCAGRLATAAPVSPFRDNAFVGRDSVENVTALFVELAEDAEPPAQIDVIYFGHVGSVLATLKNVPVRALPAPSRWVYAVLPELVPADVQASIRLATSASFVVGGARADAYFVYTNLGWKTYLPDRMGTGTCPNCTKAYLCHCMPTLYDIRVGNGTFCGSIGPETCKGLRAP